MIKITRIRTIVQIIFAFILLYLGMVGVRMFSIFGKSLAIPTLSCHYVNKRVANCFLYMIQYVIPEGWKTYYIELLIVTAMFAVFVLLFGRAWCSWACPLGLLQDIFINIRRFLKLSYIKYNNFWTGLNDAAKYTIFTTVFLVLISIGIPGFFLSPYRYDLDLIFCQICPSKKFLSFLTGTPDYLMFVDDITGITTFMSYLSITVSSIYLLGTATVRRFWCRICPLSVLMGLLSKFAFLSLKKEVKRCTKCGICARTCPVQIKKVYEEKENEHVTVPECILCFRCLEFCPENKCLSADFLGFHLLRSSYKLFYESSPVAKKKKNTLIKTTASLLILLFFSIFAFTQETAFMSSTHDVKQPVVATEEKNIYLTWIDNRDNNPNIYFRKSADEGLTWSKSTRLSKKDECFCFPTAIVANGKILHVAWIDYGYSMDGEICYIRSENAGETWSEEVVLVPDTNSSRFPLLVLENNYVYLTWQDVENNVYFKASYDGGLNWEKDIFLTKLVVHSCFCYPPAIGVTNGKIVVAYPNLVGNKKYSSISYMESVDHGKTWSNENILLKTPVKDKGFDEMLYPIMASDSSSTLFLSWIDKRVFRLGELYYVYSNDSGETWSKEKRIAKERTAPKRPSILLDSKNDFHVAWAGFLNKKSKIMYTKTTNNQGKWMKHKTLIEKNSRYHDPVICLTSSGMLHMFCFDDAGNWSKIFYQKSIDNGKTWKTAEF